MKHFQLSNQLDTQAVFPLISLETPTFLDIGCSSPEHSVCFPLLNRGCDGYFIDIEYFDGWDTLNFYQVDSTKTDWSFIDKDIDYVSIDVDECGDRFRTLKNLNWNWDIKVITIEHDVYRNQYKEEPDEKDGIIQNFGMTLDWYDAEKAPQIKFLQDKGFELICDDVTFVDDRGMNQPFEDWWVKSELVSEFDWVRCKKQDSEALYHTINEFLVYRDK